MRPPCKKRDSEPSSRGPGPAERGQTVRQEILRCLGLGLATARQLSALVHIPEKEVALHLEHLARTLRAVGRRLEVQPAECLDCGFSFAKRSRLTRPSACPSCRGSHIEPPAFQVLS